MSMQFKLVVATIAIISTVVVAFLIIESFYLNPNEKQGTIKVGYVPSISAAPMFIGMNRGYFHDEGIELALTEFKKGHYTLEALVRGDIDVAVCVPLSARMFNAFESGVPVYMVAGMSQALPWLSIRKDLWDSKAIREIKDLGGKRIQVGSEGSGSYFGIAYVLKQEEIDIKKDVDLVYLDQDETLAALESKSIDAASLRPPHLTSARMNGLVVLYPNMSEYFRSDKGYQRAVIFASGRFIDESPELLRDFLRAFVDAIKIYNYAYENEEPYRMEVVGIISNLTGIDEETVRIMEWLYMPGDGKPDMELVREMHDYYVETAVLEEPIDLDEFIDLSFLP